jgi:hypothetical protein
MTQKRKTRARRLRRIAALMMMLCFAVAAGRLITASIPIFDPGMAAAEVTCSYLDCSINRSLPRLLPHKDGRPQVAAGAPDIETVIAQPLQRVLIAAGSLGSAVPAALMFLALGLGLRALGRRRDLAGAIPWLRRAALAAMASVVMEPIAATLRATALSPVSLGRQQVFIMVDVPDLLWGVMITGTLWVVILAFEQALKSERELAEIV